MAEKLDYKKEYKDLYMPARKPMLVRVPAMPFISVDGDGAPESDSYQQGIPILYALTMTIKMSKMGGNAPSGYFEYVVPPLEGLWDSGAIGYNPNRDAWKWTSMIRQPDFVTDDVFAWALAEATRKKPELDFSRARFGLWEEGLCVQAMHHGPYATEPETLEGMQAFMRQNGLVEDFSDMVHGLARRHHEIYLGDPRRAAPEKRRTVLRHPVKPIAEVLENE